ncbi:MAG: S-adenosylmethionine decarboxylase [Candidatus Pacebacteria bacterium]|nr:S-adenosylmethionine decarboxylase [Candidatus Paceibacterota bacterium]
MEKKKTFNKDDYGLELNLDLYGCNPETIRSKKKIKEFIDGICAEIKMKKYGKAFIPNFGHGSPKTAGFSLVQLIETSSIVGHFSDLYNSAYLDIFSCKSFDPDKAARYAAKFFGAKKFKKRLIIRK